MVSVLAFYSDNLSSNPAEVQNHKSVPLHNLEPIFDQHNARKMSQHSSPSRLAKQMGFDLILLIYQIERAFGLMALTFCYIFALFKVLWYKYLAPGVEPITTRPGLLSMAKIVYLNNNHKVTGNPYYKAVWLNSLACLFLGSSTV